MSENNGNNEKNEATASNQDADILLKQWQTCTQLADSISSRSDSMNRLFTTLCLAILAAFPLIEMTRSILLLTGALLSLLWCLMICYYRKLNKAKYKVICEIETRLPYNPIEKEWLLFKNDCGKLMEGTILELGIPVLFLVLFIALFIYNINIDISLW